MSKNTKDKSYGEKAIHHVVNATDKVYEEIVNEKIVKKGCNIGKNFVEGCIFSIYDIHCMYASLCKDLENPKKNIMVSDDGQIN